MAEISLWNGFAPFPKQFTYTFPLEKCVSNETVGMGMCQVIFSRRCRGTSPPTPRIAEVVSPVAWGLGGVRPWSAIVTVCASCALWVGERTSNRAPRSTAGHRLPTCRARAREGNPPPPQVHGAEKWHPRSPVLARGPVEGGGASSSRRGVWPEGIRGRPENRIPRIGMRSVNGNGLYVDCRRSY